MKENESAPDDGLFDSLNAFLRGEYTKPAAPEPELPKQRSGPIYKTDAPGLPSSDSPDNEAISSIMELLKMISGAVNSSTIKWFEAIEPGISRTEFSSEFQKAQELLDSSLLIKRDILEMLMTGISNTTDKSKVGIYIILKRIRAAAQYSLISHVDAEKFVKEVGSIVDKHFPEIK